MSHLITAMGQLQGRYSSLIKQRILRINNEHLDMFLGMHI